jgi:hypothetical protein
MKDKKDKYILIALIIIIALLLFLVFSLVSAIRRLRTSGALVYPHSTHFYRIQARPATAADVKSIAGWMTFNYLNKSFNLPPEYLQTELNISDKAYPNLIISKIAQGQKLSAGAYLETVKNAVSAYLLQNLPLQ